MIHYTSQEYTDLFDKSFYLFLIPTFSKFDNSSFRITNEISVVLTSVKSYISFEADWLEVDRHRRPHMVSCLSVICHKYLKQCLEESYTTCDDTTITTKKIHR